MRVGITMAPKYERRKNANGGYSQEYEVGFINISYAEFAISNGLTPVFIPPVADDEFILELIKDLDLILFSGGEDVDPLLYGQNHKEELGPINMQRDAFELKLMDMAYKNKIPMFGICRGLQLMNVYFGGTLYQDIKSQYETYLCHNDSEVEFGNINHSVKILPIVPFFKAFHNQFMPVNSYHHQAIDVLSPSFDVFAISEDGLIEGIIHKDNPYILAVQWHPERMASYPEQNELLSYLQSKKIYINSR